MSIDIEEAELRSRSNSNAAGTSSSPPLSEQPGTADSAPTNGIDAELAAMRDRWMRSEAEMANVRARAKRDVDEARQFAVQKFATDVVEAAENLGRGLASIPEAVDGEPHIVTQLREGFNGVERNFIDLLKRNGVERQDPTGAPFDPKLHQAMAEQETDSHDVGTVVHAMSGAWTLNGRLLRPAMVVVAKVIAAQPASDSFHRAERR